MVSEAPANTMQDSVGRHLFLFYDHPMTQESVSVRENSRSNNMSKNHGETAETNFGQTDFGHPYLTDFGQSDFGQTDFGQKILPNFGQP